jgi:hypothetical protein
MGKAFRPEDVAKGRRRLFREALRDLSPDIRDAVRRVFESWQGVESERQLVKLLGEEETNRLLKRVRPV